MAICAHMVWGVGAKIRYKQAERTRASVLESESDNVGAHECVFVCVKSKTAKKKIEKIIGRS